MQSVMVCPTCSAKMAVVAHTPGTKVLCPKCRTSFVPVGDWVSPPEAPAPLPLDEAPLSLDDAPPQSAPRPPSRVPKIIAAVMATVVVAAIGVAIWSATKDGDRPTAEAAPTPKAEKPPEKTAEPKVEPKAEPQPEPPPPKSEPAGPANIVITDTPRTAEQINRRLLKSTVWILTPNGFGSGSLVHQKHGLVVTNYHVVEQNATVSLFFPTFDGNSDLVTDPNHYARNREQFRIQGSVVSRAPNLDLALVKLDRVPDTAPGVPLARIPAATGASVYSIGASGVEVGRGPAGAPPQLSGALWRFSTGTVRGRFRDRIVFPDQTIEAMFLETQKPINQGDSGGPTVNDRGELVGVVSSGRKNKNLVMRDIDLSEVRGFLNAHAKREGWKWDDREAAPSGSGPDPATVTQLIARVRSEKGDAQLYAVRQLATFGADAQAAVPILLAAADPTSAELEAAIGAALVQIGRPDAGAEDSVITAIGSKSGAARLYAVHTLAGGSGVPEAALTALVKALADESSEVRAAAATALGVAGTKAKAKALEPLLHLADDPDTKVAEAAAQSVAKFGPFGEGDRSFFHGKLSGEKPKARIAAAGWLGPLVLSADDAAVVWSPLLKDPVPELRAAALQNLVKYPDAVPKAADGVSGLFSDPQRIVRLTAVTQAANFAGIPGVPEKLTAIIDSDTDEEVRAAAAMSAAAITAAEIEHLPVLRKILGVGTPTARRIAAEKLALLKSAAAPAVGDLLPRLKDDDVTVRAAAIRALTAIGTEGKRAADAVTALFKADGTPDPVMIAAIDYLEGTGIAGVETLSAARQRELPSAVVAALCRAFARTGKADLLLWSLPRAAELDACRADVTAALIASGKEEHVRELMQLTLAFKYNTFGKPPERRGVAERRWAIAALSKMKLKDVCKSDTLARLADRIKVISESSDPLDAEVAADAKVFLKQLRP